MENRIEPSRPQAPPFAVPPTGQMGCSPIPLCSTFSNCPRMKNAIQRPSGDQNGHYAPSLPWISMGCVDSRALTHSVLTPSALAATNATRRPSGEMAKSFGVNE